MKLALGFRRMKIYIDNKVTCQNQKNSWNIAKKLGKYDFALYL
jgi:hypothetical protein